MQGTAKTRAGAPRSYGRVQGGRRAMLGAAAAGVAELADAPGLGPGPERGGGSSPLARTFSLWERKRREGERRGKEERKDGDGGAGAETGVPLLTKEERGRIQRIGRPRSSSGSSASPLTEGRPSQADNLCCQVLPEGCRRVST